MSDLVVSPLRGPLPGERTVEVVERKGGQAIGDLWEDLVQGDVVLF